MLAVARRRSLAPSTGAPPIIPPSSLSGLVGWWKADSLALTDGTAVSDWTDMSGAGHDLLQATGANQPIYKLAIINGHNVVRFDGTDDYMQGLWTQAQPVDTFLVIQVVADQSNQALCDGGVNLGGQIYESAFGAAMNISTYAGSFGPVATSVPSRPAHLWEFVENGASSSLAMDNTSAVTGDAGTNSPGGLTLAARGGATNFAQIDVAEAFMFNRVLNGTERGEMQAYVDSRYALW
jgi:hypothetical protein